MDLSTLTVWDSEPLEDAFERLVGELTAAGHSVQRLAAFNALPEVAPHARFLVVGDGPELRVVYVRAARWTETASWATWHAIQRLQREVPRVRIVAVQTVVPQDGPHAYWFLEAPHGRLTRAIFNAVGERLHSRNVAAVAAVTAEALRREFALPVALDQPETLLELDQLFLERLRTVDPTGSKPHPRGMPLAIVRGVGALVGEIVRRTAPDQIAWQPMPCRDDDLPELRLGAWRDVAALGGLVRERQTTWLWPFALVVNRYLGGDHSAPLVFGIDYFHAFLDRRPLPSPLVPRRGGRHTIRP